MLIHIVIGRQSESAIAAMAAYRFLEGFVYTFFALLCPAITFFIVSVCLAANRPLLGLFGLGAETMFYGKYMLLIFLSW